MFGNAAWVPGTTVVAAVVLLLVAIRIVLGRKLDSVRLDFAAPVFLALAIAFTPFHLEQWYALLGEVPAALLVVLACALLATLGLTSAVTVASGLLLGLAFLTKALAGLYFIGALAALTIVRGYGVAATEDKVTGSAVLALIAGFALPVLGFEVWKLSALGSQSYAQAWRGFFGYAGTLGNSAHGESLIARVSDGSTAFYTRFRFSLLELNAFNWFAVVVACRYAKAPLPLLATTLATGVTLQSIWWVSMSIGWPRYMIIALVISAFLAALPILFLRKAKHVAIYLVWIVLWSLPMWSRTTWTLRDFDTTRMENLEKTVAFLRKQPEETPYVGQWWATVVDLEYRLEGSRHFKGFRALEVSDWKRGFLVAVNTFYIAKEDEDFLRLLDKCGPPIQGAPPFSVYRCRAEP
jgi:hypothetical protein